MRLRSTWRAEGKAISLVIHFENLFLKAKGIGEVISINSFSWEVQALRSVVGVILQYLSDRPKEDIDIYDRAFP